MVDPSPILSMQGVSKRFGATTALKSVDLTLYPGEVLALIGENGAGKSTLMKVLSGAHLPDAGTMTLAGHPYAPRDPLAARRAGVAMIYQELSIAPHLTVAENILLGVEPTRAGLLDRRAMHARAAAALAEVGRPDICPGIRAGSLPIAAQQLVEIARSVALGARVLVLDEPTSSLTRRDIASLFAMLRRLRTAGLGIVYISHFLEEVREISDRYTVLRDGASVATGVTAEATNADIIRHMVGRDVADLYPRSHRTPGQPLLSVTALASATGKPRHASLTLHRGEVLGLAGLVGAGRTELLRALFALDPIASGQITLANLPAVDHATPRRRWYQGLGFLSEDRKSEGLATGLTLADNVTLTRLRPFTLPSRQAAATRPLLQQLSVKARSPNQKVSELSGGNQQKVALARLLHHDCDILFLDEPTRGVDIGAKAQIYALINELALAGKAILIASSYLPELMGICDRIAVMSRGTLAPARPTAEWTEHSLMAQAIAQDAA